MSYSPQFVFSLLPDTSGLPNDLPLPTQDYGLSLRDSVNYTLAGNATLQVTRRSSFTVSYGRSKYNFIDDNYDMTSRSYGGGYSHTVSRYASLRLGYAETKADYPAFAERPSDDLTQRSIDAGHQLLPPFVAVAPNDVSVSARARPPSTTGWRRFSP